MRWKRHDVVLFDCDSTLSSVEGIDELADEPSTQQAIAALTDKAMDGDVPLEDIYGERLALINPTRTKLRAVKNRYKSNVVPDAQATVAALKTTQAETWVISGGLLEPVEEFATWLGVEPGRVKAVGTEYCPFDGNWWEPAEADGRYVDYEKGHLSSTEGKAAVIDANVTNKGRRMLVGDGVSDLAAAPVVDLFVAYAGVVARPSVVEKARVVITSRSLAPSLPLALGRSQVKELIGTEHEEVARRSLELVEMGSVHFSEVTLERAFDAS